MRTSDFVGHEFNHGDVAEPRKTDLHIILSGADQTILQANDSEVGHLNVLTSDDHIWDSWVYDRRKIKATNAPGVIDSQSSTCNGC
jgi:hypothetical protein